jgi:hypothetical protein
METITWNDDDGERTGFTESKIFESRVLKLTQRSRVNIPDYLGSRKNLTGKQKSVSSY